MRLHAGDALFEDGRDQLIEDEPGGGLPHARVTPRCLGQARMGVEIEFRIGLLAAEKSG
jgi:hypothetical protein